MRVSFETPANRKKIKYSFRNFGINGGALNEKETARNFEQKLAQNC
jgi:hypothetical protein